MTELLTAKDVEVKSFKKVSFGGYSVAEVEDFLNQVVEDLETYAQRLRERDDQVQELKEYVRKQESMTDTIKGALIQAQKAASEMEGQARAQGDKILAEARLEAEKIVAEAGTRLSEAERTAADIVAKARAEAAGILQESQDKRLEIERRWTNLDQELELHRRDASGRIEQDLASAQAEAERIVEDASKEAEEYGNRLRFLNLQKQRFIKDTVTLLLEFGKTVDKAQQEMELEMNDPASPHFMDGFRKNLLEGRDVPEDPAS